MTTINDYDIDVQIEKQAGIRAEIQRNQVARSAGLQRAGIGFRLGQGVDSLFVRLGEGASARRANRARHMAKDV